MKNFFVLFFLKTMGLLPLSVSRAIGWWVGCLMWALKSRAYQKTQMNLRKCFPELTEKEVVSLARKSLIETCRTACEAGAIWRNSWAWLSTKIVSVEGEALLREELAKGKGLIVLAPHLGNWEVVAPYLASIAPLTAMYQPFPIPAIDDLILAGRSKNNIYMAPTNRKGVTMLLKALLKGTIVGILPDQVPEKEAGGEPVNFFGHPAMTMTLVSALVDRTQCRVVAVFAKRVPGGFVMITIPADSKIYNEDPLESMHGMNLSVEACVRLAPTQYQWEYSRFRELPEHLRESKNA